MKRRTFFSLLAAAGLGTGRTGQGKSLQFGRGEASPRPAKARSSSVSAAPVLERIGVQLYTLRTRLRQDFQGTLARVAEIGYREVEFAGYFGHTPQQVRTALDRLGLAAPSAHLPLELLRGEFERTLEAAHVMGHRYLIVAWLPEAERRDLDGYRRLAAWFNRAGERAREA
ncbi:MAG: sugar phosphate isomerase/epimerase, partial [Gemmatimonadetes bacterium]|nr:sugar phosphate isomerase/epimerase [Gemmatimonadota bacterium]